MAGESAHEGVLAWLKQCKTETALPDSLGASVPPTRERSTRIPFGSAMPASPTQYSCSAYIWASCSDEWPLDEPLFCEEDNVPEEDRDRLKEDIMMKKPIPAKIVLSISQWSLDHRVLTLSLLRRGPVHRRHAKMLNRYYRLMHPISGPKERRHPRYHPVLDAISMLAKEEDLQKLSNDSHRILKLWDDAMRWCVGLLGSDPSLAVTLDFQPCKTQVNYLRCPEYDALLPYEAEGLVRMPHAEMFAAISRHTDLIGRDTSAIADELMKTRIGSDENAFLQDVGREINRMYQHALLVRDDVEFLCDLLDDMDSPRADDWTPQDAAKDEVQKLKARVRRYPLGGFIDAGLFVAVDDVLDGLQSDLGPDGEQALLHDISLVAPSTTQDPAGNTVASQKATRRVLQLPILLVNHQIHECGLDDSTRNKQRLNCVSAAQFLATLGIEDFPVYGLATSGQYGYVSSTWYSSQDKCIYIADCNTAQHRFDMGEDGMFRFVNFLWGLRQHAEELKARFDSVREELVERMRSEEGRASLRWTLRSQRGEPDLWFDDDEDVAV